MNNENFNLLRDLVLEKHIATEIVKYADNEKFNNCMEELLALDRSAVGYSYFRSHFWQRTNQEILFIYKSKKIRPYFGLFEAYNLYYIDSIEKTNPDEYNEGDIIPSYTITCSLDRRDKMSGYTHVTQWCTNLNKKCYNFPVIFINGCICSNLLYMTGFKKSVSYKKIFALTVGTTIMTENVEWITENIHKCLDFFI